jgi:hypothetical protein
MQFVFQKCTQIPLGSFEVSRINNYILVLAYHCAFGPKDKWVENLRMDQSKS